MRLSAVGVALVTLWAMSAHGQLKIAGEPQAATAPPYSLTAADGTGLKLVALDAKAVVDGPLAFTELHLTFENPQARQIEGHFKVTMPDGAAISRFAMKIKGAWMEGEVVEKQAARRAYEDALHRRADPALLEQDSGNLFRARVFPIPANGRKEIIISWSNTLTEPGAVYRLPLRGLPKMAHLKLRALTPMLNSAPAHVRNSSLGGSTTRYQVAEVDKRDFTPDQDWVLSGGRIPEAGDALRNGQLAVARFIVQQANADETGLTDALVWFDTSASRAIGFERRLTDLTALIRALPSLGVTTVRVVAFDQTAVAVFAGAPAKFGATQLTALRNRGALGASSLSAVFDTVRAGAGHRIILLSDGMVTAGERDLEALQRRVEALAAHGIQRFDVVVDTTARDANLLNALVTSALPRPGKVIEGRLPLDTQLRRLGRRALADVNIEIPGATWVQPKRLRGLQDGDAVVVFADLNPEATLEIQLSGGSSARITPVVEVAPAPLLQRAWIQARIARLERLRADGDRDMKAAFKQQILALSTKHRVLSRYTAMVVLETEAEYARFGIERDALADILIVGQTGVELTHRKHAVVKPPPPKPKPVVQEKKSKSKKSVRRRIARDDDDMDEAPGEALMPARQDPANGAALQDETGATPEDDAIAGDAPVMEAAEMPSPAPSVSAPASVQTRVSRRSQGRTAHRGGRRPRRPTKRQPPTGRREYDQIAKGTAALNGRMAKIDRLLKKRKHKKALKLAKRWRAEAPADLLALIALGRAYRASNDDANAARAFGSLLDLYPSRADMRRMAGNWLEWMGAYVLAADTYQVALSQRPDHPSIYHLLSMVLVRQGLHEAALKVAIDGVTAKRAYGRFNAVDRILKEDAQLIAAAWATTQPKRREEIANRLDAAGLKIDTRRSMRFVLSWETDANDVDFHIFDKAYNHAYYSRRALPKDGGELYADITSGYGPECFTIYDPKKAPYRLKAHYYSRGPMGYGGGKLQILRHDGKGHLSFEERPFMIMADGAYVDLGKVTTRTARGVKKR